MWGRGIYFARKASYSDAYACTHTDGSKGMFLAKILIGETIVLQPDSNLQVPPEKPGSKRRYDSVQGHTQGSDVFIVYHNRQTMPFYYI
jgi:hypothetical protein